MANKKDLANGLIGTALTSAATTLVLQAGYGASMPAVPFFLTITPAGQLSTRGNSEIVNVTARTGDTLTITRAQKGTTARSFSAGDIVSNGIYADASFDSLDVDGDIYSNGRQITGCPYDVGDIYMTVNPSRNTAAAVAARWPGTTWEAWGAGRVPVGFNSSDSDFDSVEKTGGSKEVTLSPQHYMNNIYATEEISGVTPAGSGLFNANGNQWRIYSYFRKPNTAHPNLQPYITCYMWKRTA